MVHLQLTITCVTYIIVFNITTTCMLFFQNKWPHEITSFIYYMTDMVPIIYSRIPLNKDVIYHLIIM